MTDTAGLSDDGLHVLNLSLTTRESTQLREEKRQLLGSNCEWLGLVSVLLLACLLVCSFRFIAQHGLCCNARRRNVCRLRKTRNRNHDRGGRNASINIHQMVQRNIQSHPYSSRKAYPIQSEQATGHPPNHHNQGKNNNIPSSLRAYGRACPECFSGVL